MPRRRLDLSGKKFNKLTIIKPISVKNRSKDQYYSCKCDCGTIKTIRGDVIKNGWVKSCGCIRGLPEGESTSNYVMLRYKQQAKRRGYIFKLSSTIFKKLIKQNCYYCGAKPNNTVKQANYKGILKYNGVDRKNNKKGYIKNNVVACCRLCNFMKQTMTDKQFITHAKKIAKQRKV